MLNTPTRDTPCEVALRSALHARGLRFRLDKAPVEGLRRKADVIFGPARVAVFVDGCFWHLCPVHGSLPKANGDWWRAKLEGNRARDRDTDERLIAADWLPIRVWEHDDPVEAASLINAAVRRRRRPPPKSRRLHQNGCI